MLVTADHGTVERWLYPEGTIDTGHTDSPVPCILAMPPSLQRPALRGGGSLVDMAPTVLDLLGLATPAAMTGHSLLEGRVPGARGGCCSWCAMAGAWHRLAAPTSSPRPGLPSWTDCSASCPHTLLAASGEAVGLPPDTVGNSEAGHLHLGAGRVVPADRVRIASAIADGSFFDNPVLRGTADAARSGGRPLHLLGIVSFFSSHGSLEHLFALLELARRAGVPEVWVHGLLGRRGERPQSGAHYVGLIEEKAAAIGVGQVASVIGRYWALDREQHWDRVKRTYDLLVRGVGRASPLVSGSRQARRWR